MLIELDSREIVLLITGKMVSFKTPNSLYNNKLLKDHRKNGSIPEFGNGLLSINWTGAYYKLDGQIPSEIFHAEVEVEKV